MSKPSYWVYNMTNRSGTLELASQANLRGGSMNIATTCYQASPPVIASIDWSMKFAMPSPEKKQLKGRSRARKIALIAESNPQWRDLGEAWFGPGEVQ